MACNSQFDGGTYPPGSSGDPRDCYNVTPNTHTTVPPPVSNSYVSSSISAGHVHGVTAQIKNHPTMIDSHVGLAEKEPYLTFSMESHKPTQKLSPTASTFQPPNKSSENILASYSQPMFACLSKDLGVSRYLIAASASINITHSDIVAYIANFPNLRGRYYTFERFNGVYVAFTDVRDSSNSFNNAAKLRPDWRMHYVESFDFYKHVGSDLREDKQKTDGVLNIIALMAPSSSHSTHRAASMVVEILSAYGQIFGIVGLAGFETGTMRAIVEYCDLESATAANIRCNGVSVDGIYISAFPGRMAAAAVDVTSPISRDGSSPDDLAVSLHHQGISGPEQTAGRLSVTRHAARESHPIGHHMHPFMMPIMHQPQISIGSPYMVDRSPQRQMGALANLTDVPVCGPVYNQSQYRISTPTSFLQRGRDWAPSTSESRRHNATRISRVPLYPANSNHHNHVDIERIRSGQDVRTTIMLRNIPNKVTQADLKTIVDQSSLGKYDFMYLRIDFANDCNVGYAFINFVDVSSHMPAIFKALTRSKGPTLTDTSH
jgi:hypothetical protein